MGMGEGTAKILELQWRAGETGAARVRENMMRKTCRGNEGRGSNGSH